METQFYILGLLHRYGPQHGYMLKQTVEDRISDFAQIKMPTIYYHLEKLNQKGYISATIQKEGNRPEKTVYSISKKGEDYFFSLLAKMQSEEMQMGLPFDGAIYFKDLIDTGVFNNSVRKSIVALEEKLNRVVSHRDHVFSFIPEDEKDDAVAIFNHHIYHIEAELRWFRELEKGE